MNALRYVYFLNRNALLTDGERRAGTTLAPLFFPAWEDGELPQGPRSFGREWVVERGAASRGDHGGEAIRGLLAANVIVEVKHRFTHRLFVLLPDEQWAWLPGERELVLDEWDRMHDPAKAWKNRTRAKLATIVAPIAHLTEPQASPSPWDPRFANWLAMAAHIRQRFGIAVVRDAFQELGKDPDVLGKVTPKNLRRSLYGLVQRARRARGTAA